MTMQLATPNHIVWNYFAALRRLASGVASVNDDPQAKQDIALCVILSVASVEAFLNVYFRVVVSEAEFPYQDLEDFENDVRNLSLAKKAWMWPKKILGADVSGEAAVFKAFGALVSRRHKLMHFKSGHETVSIGTVTFQGLVDVSAFEDLVVSDATRAVEIAEDVVRETFRLRGIAEEQLPHMLHAWTGRFPFEAMTHPVE